MINLGKILEQSDRDRLSPVLAMTVHHHSHHVAALSGIAVQASNAGGLNLSRLTGLDSHPRTDERVVNLDRLNSINRESNGHGIDRSESMTMPHRSRFMITDILADASSPSSLHSQEPPGSPSSAPRDLSVKTRPMGHKRQRDDDSDTSHHDGASVSSNGNFLIIFFMRGTLVF